MSKLGRKERDVFDQASKRQKIKLASDDAHLSYSPLRKSLLNEESFQQLVKQHDESVPYKHVVLESLCDIDSLRKIHNEMKMNMKATFKETDLFKVFQTPDFGAIDCTSELGKAMPTLFNLRKSIYSEEFRSFIAKVTGVTDLTDRVDCSANAYSNGCHLLCHDDVIGTRRISYIIYLSDPDTPWEAEDGGALELYPLVEEDEEGEAFSTDQGAQQLSRHSQQRQGIPAVLPTKVLLPHYNTMAVFAVQPGRSYHSVQEVFTDSKPRLSISGWFHGPDPPKGADKASLNQIMTKGDDLRAFTPIQTSVSVSRSVSVEEHSEEDKAKKEKREKLNSQEKDGKEKKKPKKNEEEEKREVEIEMGEEDLTDSEIEVLKQWISPRYLDRKIMSEINEQFCENSSLQLKGFLKKSIEQKLTGFIVGADEEDEIGDSRPQLNYEKGVTRLNASSSGDDDKSAGGWALVGPPHKRRHLVYESGEPGTESSNKTKDGKKKSKTKETSSFHANQKLLQQQQMLGSSKSNQAGHILDSVRSELLRTPLFAKYLRVITSLNPRGYRDEIRRFRAGLDYTVAHYGLLTKVPRLDATLCFVNDIEDSTSSEPETTTSKRGKINDKVEANSDTAKDGKEEEEGGEEEEDEDEEEEGLWESGDVGGFECYIEVDESETAEAAEVYRSGGNRQKSTKSNENPTTQSGKGKEQQKEEEGDEEESEEEDDSALLSVSPGNNVLSLVMRDEGIMKFIKYVSANAPGSRWDVAVEYEIEDVEPCTDDSSADLKEGDEEDD